MRPLSGHVSGGAVVRSWALASAAMRAIHMAGRALIMVSTRRVLMRPAIRIVELTVGVIALVNRIGSERAAEDTVIEELVDIHPGPTCISALCAACTCHVGCGATVVRRMGRSPGSKSSAALWKWVERADIEFSALRERHIVRADLSNLGMVPEVILGRVVEPIRWPVVVIRGVSQLHVAVIGCGAMIGT